MVADEWRCGMNDMRVADRMDTIELRVSSPALKRLIEEVSVAPNVVPRGYNRTYNRHNR